MNERKNLGRGLDVFEVALIKNMRGRKMARDFIMSLIVRPGRVISPAAVGEVFSGKIGPDVSAATDAETDFFISRRLSGYRPVSDSDLGGPTSQTVLLEVLEASTPVPPTVPASESQRIVVKCRN